MSVTISNKYLFLAILIALGGIFFLGRYTGHKRAEKASEALIFALQDTVSSYKYKVGNLNMTAFEQAQIITTQKEAIKRGDLEKKELRALNLKYVNEINKLSLQVDTLLENVNHSGTIIIVQQNTIDSLNRDINRVKVSQKAILLPFTFDKTDKWLNLKGTFNSEGKLDIGLKLDFKADLWAGVDRTTRKNVAVLTTDCPYVRTISFESIKLDSAKKKRYGISLQFGYGVLFTSPIKTGFYGGVGFDYSFIRF